MSEFGTQLRELRKAKQLTQRDLAKKVGVSFTYISKIESGNAGYIPSAETIKRLAAILEVNEDELLLLAKKIPESVRNVIIENDFSTAFLRKVPTMTNEQKKAINDILEQ